MSDLIFDATDNTDNSTIKFNTSMISKIVTPSTAKKGMSCTQGQVSFTSDTLFSQVSAAALHTTGNNPSNKDNNTGPRINESINHGTGRNSNKNPLAHWQDQIQEEEEAANHNIILCSFKDDGPLTKTCIDLNLGENMVMEAKVSTRSTRNSWRICHLMNGLKVLGTSLPLFHSWLLTQQITQH